MRTTVRDLRLLVRRLALSEGNVPYPEGFHPTPPAVLRAMYDLASVIGGTVHEKTYSYNGRASEDDPPFEYEQAGASDADGRSIAYWWPYDDERGRALLYVNALSDAIIQPTLNDVDGEPVIMPDPLEEEQAELILDLLRSHLGNGDYIPRFKPTYGNDASLMPETFIAFVNDLVTMFGTR